MFICDKCGLCCMKVGESKIYAELDRGDGICRHFNDYSKLCMIYENRPALCNVDEMFDRLFCQKMTKEEYYDLNYEFCKKFKTDVMGV